MSKKSAKNIAPDIDDGVVHGAENIIVAEQAPITDINDIPSDIVAGLLKRGLSVEFIHTLDLKSIEAIGLARKSDSVKRWRNGEGPRPSKVQNVEQPEIEVKTTMTKSDIIAEKMLKLMEKMDARVSSIEKTASSNQHVFLEAPEPTETTAPDFVLPDVPKKSAPVVKAKKLVYVKHYTFTPTTGKQKGQDVDATVMSIRGFEAPKENYYGYMPFVFKKATVAALNEDLEAFGEAEFLRRLKALKLHIS